MRTLMTMIAILILPAAYVEGHDIYSGLMDNLGQSSCCNTKGIAVRRITGSLPPALKCCSMTSGSACPMRSFNIAASMAIPAKLMAGIGAASRIGKSRIRSRGSNMRYLRIIRDCIYPGFSLAARSCRPECFESEICCFPRLDRSSALELVQAELQWDGKQ